MAISVTQFRANCLELIRRAEGGGEPVDIKRRGKVVARLTPAPKPGKVTPQAWEALRGSGELKAEPEESVIDELDRPFDVWIREAAGAAVIEIAPLDVEIVNALNGLPASFHGDPADRLIVATARAHRIPLATHDRVIRRSRAAIIWKAR